MERFKIHEERMYKFIQVPKEFFINSRYKSLSSNSKLLYSLLLDRMELSRKNKWVNEKGEIYLIYTRKHMQDILNISDKTCTKVINELKKAELIEEKRIGLNKPNLLYVGHIKYDGCRNNYDSNNEESSFFKAEDLRCNNTDNSKTDYLYNKEETITDKLNTYILKVYQQCIDYSISEVEIDELIKLQSKVNVKILEKAIILACLNNKKNLMYIKKVIEDWRNKGLDTIEKVEGYLNDWSKKNELVRKKYDERISKLAINEKGNAKVGFNNFEPRSYDYDSLEKKLLGWDKEDEEV